MNENVAELILALTVLTALGLAVAFHSRGAVASETLSAARPRRDFELAGLLLLCAATLVLVPVMDVAVSWFEFADTRFRRALAWLGAGFAGLALIVFWAARRDFGRFIGEPAPLPWDRGVHRFVRHPLYSALLLWTVGHCLLSQNWLVGAGAVVTFVVLYGLRVPREEQTLLERFGHRYLEYMERTGSLLPRLPGSRSR